MSRLVGRHPIGLIGLVLIVLLAAAGCGSEGPASVGSGSGSTERTGLAAALDGRTFDSTSVTLAGAPRPVAAPITITFEGDVLRANPGCNTSGGHYSLDGGRLTMSAMDSTVMACADTALMDQDTWFGSLLEAGASLALDGDQLTLTSGDTVIVLVDHQTVDPDRPLVGTTWTLESINDGPTASSVPVGMTVTLSLPTSSTITWTACNRAQGQLASMDGTTFTVGEVRSTEMACPDARSQVETAMSEVLQGSVAYEIDGSVLHLTNGVRRLDLRAA